MYSRVEYAIRTTWISGRRAVVIAGPSPLDDVAGLDGHGSGAEDGTTLSHGNIRRRRGSDDWKEEDEKGDEPEMHFEGRTIPTPFLTRRLDQMTGPPSIRLLGSGKSGSNDPAFLGLRGFSLFHFVWRIR